MLCVPYTVKLRVVLLGRLETIIQPIEESSTELFGTSILSKLFCFPHYFIGFSDMHTAWLRFGNTCSA